MGRKLFLSFVAVLSAVLWMRSGGPPPVPELDPAAWWGPRELQTKQDKSIRPFKVQFTDAMVTELKQRLQNRKKFVAPLEGVAFQYGFNTDYLEKVLYFWQNDYNFKEREAFFNQYDQFKTNIQGLDIHYIHVKPKVQKGVTVLPMLLLHGWPGSVREFYETIPILSQPQEGYDFVFELIIPSLPGYGFSSAAVKPGLGATEISVVMRNLMQRLGHKQYYIQGGDWGSLICSALATIFPEEVIGHHTCAIVMSQTNTQKILLGALAPSFVVEPHLADRLYPLSKHFSYLVEESGYMHIQSSKPDTVGVGLSDSPAGLAAYILEKFSTWTNPAFKEAADGQLTKKYTLTQLIDNLMLYWSTNSITTSMRLYSESFNKRHLALQIEDIPTPVPTWAIQARHELSYVPAKLLRHKYPNLLGATILDDGGHFAALELPETLSKDIFLAVQAFRKFHKDGVLPSLN